MSFSSWRGRAPGARRSVTPHLARRTTRSGCTLAELVVALVLCAVGLLALIAAAALLVRETGVEQRETDALARARARLARLAAAGCGAPASGTETDARMIESWRTVHGPGTSWLLSDSVSFPVPGGRRSITLRSAVRC